MLAKEFLPLDIEFMVSDALEMLRPKLDRAKNFADAHAAMLKVFFFFNLYFILNFFSFDTYFFLFSFFSNISSKKEKERQP